MAEGTPASYLYCNPIDKRVVASKPGMTQNHQELRGTDNVELEIFMMLPDRMIIVGKVLWVTLASCLLTAVFLMQVVQPNSCERDSKLGES